MTQLEKEELARKLHDGIGGTLSTITTLARYGETLDDPARCREAFGQIAQLSGKGVAELRSFLNGFRVDASSQDMSPEH